MKTLKELEMAVKIVEAIELYRKLMLSSTEIAKGTRSYDLADYHIHKACIYARCIGRLKLRYKKLMND